MKVWATVGSLLTLRLRSCMLLLSELEAMRSLEKFQAMQQFSISACPETLLEPDRFKGQFV